MVSRDACKKGLARLKDMPGFPKEDEAERKKQMLDALQFLADDDAHVERSIDHAWQAYHFCPSPVEIRQSVSATYVPKPTHDENCTICSGTGWVTTARVAAKGAFAGHRYEAVDECKCRTVAPNWAAMDEHKKEKSGFVKVGS